MKKILHITSPGDYAKYVNAPLQHPLVSIIHYDELQPFRHSLNDYGVYGLFIQRSFFKEMSYGTRTVDVRQDSILAVAPGQMGGVEDNGELITLSGWVILFSQDLINGTFLEKKVKDCPYFNYFYMTPLQMNAAEWKIITGILSSLREEIGQSPDSTMQRQIIVDYIALILGYCDRIHNRQHQIDDRPSRDILKRFRALLDRYYESGRQYELGLPSVRYCASELGYSPRYFGDLVNRLTGNTAIAYIHAYVIGKAKSLLGNGYNVNETSRLLGFRYANHFTRLFRNVTGRTPSRM